MRPAKPASQWLSARPGRSAPSSAGGRRSANSEAGTGTTPGPPVHDDLVERNFTADSPNQSWSADITEHWTREGKPYVSAIKGVYSNRIVGYSIDSRMKSRLAVAALDNAVARRHAQGAEVAGCVPHSDRGSQFRSRKFVHALNRHTMLGSALQATTPPWSSSSACCRRTSSTADPGPPRGAPRHADV
jgi:putative transposase